MMQHLLQSQQCQNQQNQLQLKKQHLKHQLLQMLQQQARHQLALSEIGKIALKPSWLLHGRHQPEM